MNANAQHFGAAKKVTVFLRGRRLLAAPQNQRMPRRRAFPVSVSLRKFFKQFGFRSGERDARDVLQVRQLRFA